MCVGKGTHCASRYSGEDVNRLVIRIYPKERESLRRKVIKINDDSEVL